MTDVPTAAAEVLKFWFGDVHPEVDRYSELSKLWFRKDPAVDQEIRDRFLSLYEQAAAGQLDSWQQVPSQCVALLVLLDQFPRNLFRNTPQAFATDGKAREVAQSAIAQGMDQQVLPLLRLFFYLPLEHSENLEHQRQSVALFKPLAEAYPALADVYAYAIRHQVVIERFGRFPHRNVILGRESTPEEVEFLKQPGSSF